MKAANKWVVFLTTFGVLLVMTSAQNTTEAPVECDQPYVIEHGYITTNEPYFVDDAVT